MKDNEEIVSFEASRSFRAILISSEDLVNGNYELYMSGENSGDILYGIYQNSNYTKGEQLTINGINTFEVTKTVNVYQNR